MSLPFIPAANSHHFVYGSLIALGAVMTAKISGNAEISHFSALVAVVTIAIGKELSDWHDGSRPAHLRRNH